MDQLANQELTAFWASVMSALQAATYVSGGLFMVIFLTMAVTEFRYRRKHPAAAPPEHPRD